ncbi:MAG: hypothetical protein ACREPM_14480 [Gemmatimonadaceae bacterium]
MVHWEAVDTHGGEDIEIYNIKGRGNAIGAEVTYDATDDIAPRNVTVRRCEFDAGGNTKHQTAIEINGSATSPAVDCSIEDCESRGYGLAGASEYGAFRVQNAIRPVVRRIKAFDSVEAGLVLLGKVTEFKGEDVHVERLTGRSGMVAAVKVPYGKVDGTLDGVSGDAGLFAGVRAASPQALDVQNCTILTKGTRFSPDPKYFRRARDRSERE